MTMKKNGITFKIFGITSLLLVVSALIIYLTLYFLLPNFYLNYKKDNLDNQVQQLIDKLAETSSEDADNLFTNFVYEHNVRMIIENDQAYAIYPPIESIMQNETMQDRFRAPGGKHGSGRMFIEREFHGAGVMSSTATFSLKEEKYSYKLTVATPLQPIDEASKVILMFFPYMLIVIIVISTIGAFIYSRLIAKPLIRLNKTAKKMAELDFSTKSTINTNDELGELSESLNELSENLKRNIDELQQANLHLKDDIQKERDQEEKRREFIATISHELKSPITAVSGQLEGMIYEIGNYKNRDKYLRQSHQIMKEMEKLVLEILDLSQLESFQFTPNLQKVNFSALVEKNLESFYYFRDEENIKFATLIEPDLFIEADEKLITKAVANVISNAVKYCEVAGTVKTTLQQADASHITLTISNSGSYIEENFLNKIFEPFYRVEKSRNRKTGGSGLGLYIVKKILAMHHAQYEITNSPNGVLFTINFKRE